jgi:hypothetical protein
MEEHGKMGADGAGRSIVITEHAGFNDALLRLTDSDVQLLMVPEEVVSRLTWRGM